MSKESHNKYHQDNKEQDIKKNITIFNIQVTI